MSFSERVSFSKSFYLVIHSTCERLLHSVLPAGKIDLVKSKFGLGFTAFATVVAGLTMSLGVCTFFGLSISLSGR